MGADTSETSTGSAPSAATIESLQAELAQTRQALAAAERRLEDDQRREALLRSEIQHRVRNALALVRSIFGRSVATAETLESLSDHFIGRLDVLVRYQLSRTHDAAGSNDLAMMVDDELQTFHAGGDPRITLEGSEIQLPHDVAQVMGFALHELATNSVKFGVLGSTDARARLRVAWERTDTQLDFVWEETGIAVLGAAPPHSGFGREFIEQALPYQLRAETDFALRPGGLRCTISVPLAALQSRPAEILGWDADLSRE